jgi:autotransporter passenger strand-loop-strand repeat protein
MTTITVTGTTSVSKHIANTTGYVVDGARSMSQRRRDSGPIDVVQGSVDVRSGVVPDSAVLEGQFTFMSVEGVANSTTVSNFAQLTINNSGTANFGTVVSNVTVNAGGVANSMTVGAGGVVTVQFGSAIISGMTFSGGSAFVEGLAVSTTIVAGGSITVDFGSASASVISSGCLKVVGANGGFGNDVSATVLTGGTLIVSQGGAASAPTISNGGALIVDGGQVTGNILNDGTLTLLGGGVFPTTISGSGALVLAGGGVYELPAAANVTFSGIGNLLEIDSAAPFSSSGDVISGFGRNEAIELVGVAFNSASTISLTTSNVLVISANGSSYSFHLDPNANYSGGTFGLFSAGGADTVIGFNQQPITKGCTPIVLPRRPKLETHPAGARSGATRGPPCQTRSWCWSSASRLSSGGLAISTTIAGTLQGFNNLGGTQFISSGGIASGTTITSAGLQIVSAGGTATSTSLVDDGTHQVFGTAVSTTLGGSGTATLGQFIGSGGTALGTTINSGGLLSISNGGVAIGATINSSGGEGLGGFFVAGGTAINTTINNGGKQTIAGGIPVSGVFTSTGTAINTTINSGGLQAVGNFEAGAGTASNTIINSGGEQNLTTSSITVSTTCIGGLQIVGDGNSLATASATTILSGGTEITENLASAISTTVGSGGLLDTLFGGTIVSAVISGGTITVGNATSVGGDLTFAGSGGVLEFETDSMPSAVIRARCGRCFYSTMRSSGRRAVTLIGLSRRALRHAGRQPLHAASRFIGETMRGWRSTRSRRRTSISSPRFLLPPPSR